MSPAREPVLTRTDDGVLEVTSIPGVLAWALSELPGLLADGAPGIGKHMAPSPFPADDEEDEEWARHAGPELRHLFVSARSVVLGDLRSLARVGRSLRFRMSIPETHRTAWLSALAAARVALGDVHAVEAADMSRPLEALAPTERDRAIYLVHLLGWMQALLIGGEEEP